MLDPDRLIPLHEAADLIDAPPSRVSEWVKTGRVPSERPEERWLNEHEYGALRVPRQQFLHSLYYRNGRLEPLAPPPNGRPLPAPPRPRPQDPSSPWAPPPDM
jgi:hypothetical protein